MTGAYSFAITALVILILAVAAIIWVSPIGKDRLIELNNARYVCEDLNGVYLEPQRTIYDRPECWVDGKRVFPEGFI